MYIYMYAYIEYTRMYSGTKFQHAYNTIRYDSKTCVCFEFKTFNYLG